MNQNVDENEEYELLNKDINNLSTNKTFLTKENNQIQIIIKSNNNSNSKISILFLLIYIK
jgi:hypothetical protein